MKVKAAARTVRTYQYPRLLFPHFDKVASLNILDFGVSDIGRSVLKLNTDPTVVFQRLS